MRVLVDSNVLLDVFEPDADWYEWSAESIVRCATHGRLVINHVVFAEISVSFASIETLDGKLPRGLYERAPLPWEAAFLAGKAFLEYRRAGGTRRSPLPDFYIGAHAAVTGMTLLTRDASRYRTYFPTVELIAPDA
ncbi:MAG TPA: type II toxin-antitoxin system VapC family toxin [Thermoleophilia bacterium]|nr:type II toxin-antitoxin system VapC family toxin [Thermoleophilia bacterium]